MLVLSRQRDESIIIGDHIVVTVVDIRGDKVRLGIEAPKEVPVHRQEVYEAIQRENALKTSDPKVNAPKEYHDQYRLRNMIGGEYVSSVYYNPLSEFGGCNLLRTSLVDRIF